MYRYALMEVLVDAAMHYTTGVLDKINPDAWLAFTNWFIEFSNNNLYQNLFYKLYHIAIKTRHISSLKSLFIRSKFLGKMIKHFLDNDNHSGSKAMILLMANYLRLEGDCDAPTDFIPNYLDSHEGWKDFLPILKKETLYQLTSGKLEAPGSPQPQIAPFFIARIPHYKFNGIDLDSNYSDMLGVSKKTISIPVEETPTLRLSATVPPPSPLLVRNAVAKKRNRKKKKKSGLSNEISAIDIENKDKENDIEDSTEEEDTTEDSDNIQS